MKFNLYIYTYINYYSMRFNVSDLVVLKSGGPVLTVKSTRFAKEGIIRLGPQSQDRNTHIVKVRCQWWDKASNSFQEQEFNEDVLEKYIAVFFA